MTTPGSTKLRRRVAISSYLGTTIEYYDFLLYGSAAALVFNKVFFSDLPPLIGTIVALATLAAGYVARFAGAVLFGHYGDIIGRKRVMLITMTVMGLSSGLIGLLPTNATIGIAAPLLLLVLRLLQGLAVGGEYGGAVLMTSEHATTGRRGLAASAAAMGAPSGAVLATGAMTLVSLLGPEALLAWGWRIPFLASFLLLALGLWFRARIEESPVFLDQAKRTTGGTRLAPSRSPIVVLLRTYPGTVVKSVLVQIGSYSGQGIFGVFLLSYAVPLGYPSPLVLLTIMIGTLASVLMTPVYAGLSDRIGRRKVLLFGTIANGAIAYPMFLAINSLNTAVFVTAVIIYLAVVMTAVTAVAPVLLSELFGTEVRYTGVSASYQLAQTIGSGFGPLVAASLLAAAGGGSNSGLVSLYLLAVAVVSLLALLRLPETAHTELTSVEDDRRRDPDTGDVPETTPAGA